MANAWTRGWGDPDSRGYRENNIVKTSGGGVTLWVHKEVAPIFGHFLDALSRKYPLTEFKPTDDWGYANRDVRGRPGVKSNHSWGLAVDINATENPMTADPTARYQFKREVVNPLLARYQGKLIWGGDYAGERKDYMHFEFVGTPLDARKVVGTLKTPVVKPVGDVMSPEQEKRIMDAINNTNRRVGVAIQNQRELAKRLAPDLVLLNDDTDGKIS